MKYMETFSSLFGEKSEQIFRDILFEYKYLQSLRFVTRGITHNYNNIFAGAMGYAGKEGATSDHRQKELGSLVHRGMENTDVLYSFARTGGKSKDLHSLATIVTQAVKALEALSPRLRVTVQNRAELHRVEGCQGNLVLMFFYLVENRMDVLEKGGKVAFDIEAIPGDQEIIRVVIKDDGPDEPLTNLLDIFYPFIGTPEEGRIPGLGLHISREIARMHGGDIRIEKGNGGGAGFVVDLPVAGHVTEAASADQVVAVEHQDSTDHHVFFLIEDDQVLLNYLTTGIQRKGHMVFSAESCAEALEEFPLVHEIVTVFLIDVGLADCDGFDCMEQLMKISSTPKVIFMSGDMHNERIQAPKDALFLAKPFTIRKLEELIENDQAGIYTKR